MPKKTNRCDSIKCTLTQTAAEQQLEPWFQTDSNVSLNESFNRNVAVVKHKGFWWTSHKSNKASVQ